MLYGISFVFIILIFLKISVMLMTLTLLELLKKGNGALFLTLVLMIFNNFIKACKLSNLQLIGKKFTWFGPNSKRSRIDRFLLSFEWLFQYNNLSQRCLKRSLSYHYALFLYSKIMGWGPRLFRLLDCLLMDGCFNSFVVEKWVSFNMQGL